MKIAADPLCVGLEGFVGNAGTLEQREHHLGARLVRDDPHGVPDVLAGLGDYIMIEDAIRIALAELHGDGTFGAFSSPHSSLDMHQTFAQA